MSFLWFLSGLRTPVLNQIMLAVSYLGTPFAVFGMIAWCYLNADKDEAYGMMFSFTFSCVICQGLKVIVRMPRPWNLDGDFRAVEAAKPSASGYSFPSVHTQSAASFSESLIYCNKKKNVRVIAAAYLALVAFSRMYLGCHTPLDVATGFAVATAVTILCWIFWNRFRKKPAHDGIFLFFMAAFCTVVIALTYALLINGTVTAENARDTFETAGLSLGVVSGFMIERHFLRFRRADSALKTALLRFAVCAGGAAAVLFGLRAVLPDAPAFLVIRYYLVGIWMIGAAPFLCQKLHLLERGPA